MPKKLTIDFVKTEIKKYNDRIEIISSDYCGNKIPLQCKCLDCEHEWDAKWNNLSSNNSGCPKCYYRSKFTSQEEILKIVKQSNYTLIDVNNNYSDEKVRITVKCENDHTYSINLKTFKDGKRCKKCGNKNGGLKRRNKIENIKIELNELGFTVKEPFVYTNNKDIFQVLCSNGHEWDTSYNQWTKTKECPICNGYRYKYTYDEVYKIFLNEKCELLSEEYVDNHSLLDYRCVCGRKSEIRLTDFNRGVRCYECSFRKIAFEELETIFNSEGYVIVSNKDDYRGITYKITVKCPKGHTREITPFNFIDHSTRCFDCYHESNSGENSRNWNPILTQDEREKNRKYPEYKNWRLVVFARDDYTCQCCGDNEGGNLNAHHLDSHSWCKERRLNLDNGITLCENCHSLDDHSFHKVYGFKDTTEIQFIEWLKFRKNINMIDLELYNKNLNRLLSIKQIAL